jgi:exosortase A
LVSNAAALSSRGQVSVPLALGLLLLGIIFHDEVVSAVQVWTQSTTYNHCFLIIPIAGFLLWDRRAEIAGQSANPMPWAALFGFPIAFMWLVAERLGIMEGRQLAAMGFVELLFLDILGRHLWWAVSGPLLYLLFLAPFGAFLTPTLQDITTFFIRHGLELLGIPAYIDGNTIETPQGFFLVAEACAGLRFLIASLAFGCLYALLMYRSPLRRGGFILASVIVPIIANGMRALGIVYVGYRLNSAAAAAADHLIYGWIFFSVVILLLVAAGLPFRQDHQVARPPRREPVDLPVTHRCFVAGLTLVIVAFLGPAVSAGLARANGVRVVLPTIDVGPDCSIVATPPADPPETDLRVQRVTCGKITLDMTWEAFAARTTAATLLLERHRLCRRAETESLIESWLPDFGDQRRAWRIMRSGEPAYSLAVAIWIDGKPIRPSLTMRLRMALNTLLGSPYEAIVMTVTPAVSWQTLTPAARQQAETDITTFLLAHPDLDTKVAAISALP